MGRAKLVEFVVDLVKDEGFVVVGGVVPHDVEHGVVVENVDHLDPVKVDHDAPAGTARHVLYLVRLERGLDGAETGEQRDHEVKSRLRHTVEEGAPAIINSDVALLDLVEGGVDEHPQADRGQGHH